MEVDIILRIFMKILHAQCLEVKGATTTLGTHENFMRNFLVLSLLVKRVREEIQFFGDYVDTTRDLRLEQ